MNDSQKRVKPASVAAFLFMPQFNLCFRQFSFIVPVFIRTIAVMFEQGGLLPPNHPATRYGMEGVKKYGFFELLGEAWYTLRSESATPLRWCLFSAVIMMVAFTVLSAVTVLLNLSGLLVGTASAQIFDSVFGDTIANMPPAAAGMWDNTVPNVGSAHSDYAIMMLDKVLRQGANAVGGPLQTGLGALMLLYNTGMLVIAGIMLFWAVIAIVLDTAKTGHVGGGRHNMVWAPIRIVFGLALLIPLGSVGFNSGQFMIMKIAEWGSNFGTRGWKQYVESVTHSTLIANLPPVNASGLANQYAKMWVCRSAYNGYNMQAGVTDNKQFIKHVPNIGSDKPGQKSFSFTNNTADNICGTVTYSTENSIALANPRHLANPQAVAIATYQSAMMLAYSNLFVDVSGAVDSGSLVTDTKNFSCKFVLQYIYGVTSAGVGLNCDFSGAQGGTVDQTDLAAISQRIDTDISAAHTAAYATLDAFTKTGGFTKEVIGRGWAGMGMWYNNIATLNTSVAAMQKSPVSISAGQGMITHTMLGQHASGTTISGHDARVKDILASYDKWWETVPATAGAGAGAPGGALQPPEGKKTGGSIKGAVLSSDKEGLINAVTAKVLPGDSPFWFIDGPGKELYPLAMLTAIGQRMVTYGILIYAAVTIAGAILAVIPFVGTLGVAVLVSPLVGLFNALATAMIVPGIILALWIPILPFIRVSFSALAWIISVFEAVAMVPIAALTHLSTEGEGMGGQVRNVWILWLNILLRPILTVVGFVGALLIFNTFANYFTSGFMKVVTELNNGSSRGLVGMFSEVIYTIVYVGILYVAANSIFKMVDMIPHAVSKYMGGHADTVFDDGGAGMTSAGGGAFRGMGEGFKGGAEQGAGRYRAAKDRQQDKADAAALRDGKK